MNRDTYIASLVDYGVRTGLIEACDKTYTTNQPTAFLRFVEQV